MLAFFCILFVNRPNIIQGICKIYIHCLTSMVNSCGYAGSPDLHRHIQTFPRSNISAKLTRDILSSCNWRERRITECHWYMYLCIKFLRSIYLHHFLVIAYSLHEHSCHIHKCDAHFSVWLRFLMSLVLRS